MIAEQLQQPEQTLRGLMDSELAAAKTISSPTLFEAAGPASARQLLDQLGGKRCRQTLKRLRG